MGYNSENSPPETPNLSGRGFAALRQVYELAKKGAPGFSFDTVPEELLIQFRAEDERAQLPDEE